MHRNNNIGPKSEKAATQEFPLEQWMVEKKSFQQAEEKPSEL